MTEFVIAATYVLIPIFIGIPMLAKFIDIKQSAIQAARYEAWEYTVWMESEANDDFDIRDNFRSDVNGYQAPEKTLEQVRRESKWRFMSPSGTEPGLDITPLTALDQDNAWQATDAKPLWNNHRGLPMFTGNVTYGADTTTHDDTPTLTVFGLDVGGIFNMMLDIVETAFGLLAAVLDVVDQVGDFLGDQDSTDADPKFSAINTDGYSRVSMQPQVRVLTDREGDTALVDMRDRLQDNQLTGANDQWIGIQTGASVLADGWNSGGTNHTYLQVNGGTPSVMVKEILDLPVLDEIWDLIAFIAPELSECTNASDPEPPIVVSPFAGPEGNLWLGYVDGDVVHPDRLSVAGEDSSARLGSHVCDDAGRCIWDDDIQDLELNGMEPLSHSPCIP